jgi:gamma-glutamyltranspeptidase/glutathione hydrolase
MHERQLARCIHTFNLSAVTVSSMQAGVAAGHPATTAAGVEILEDGGSAADAAVAATLASCVAETVMTGLLGGGHAIYLDGDSGRARNLDCFVAVPGLGVERHDVELLHLDVAFGAELVHYAVGPASCGVPGLPAGLELLWREHGSLPWPRLVEPAARLAREGVDFPPAHAACLTMLAPVMTMNEGARIYAPEGRLLEAGGRLEQPGLVAALQAVAEEGAGSLYRGSLAEVLLALSAARGGLVTRSDLDAYQARWSDPVEIEYLDGSLTTRGGLAGIAETVPRLPRFARVDETERVLSLIDALDGRPDRPGDTTNVTVVDRDGNACVFTTSLGLGSGDFLPGYDLHLNSMLGEADLLVDALAPGERMQSMMAPTVALDRDGLSLAAGAAGGTRLRTALLGVVAGILDEGLPADAAVERPRFHPAPEVVNAEPGVDAHALDQLEERGRRVRRWPEQHHYFGGVSVVSRRGAAADPRRSGAAASPV